MTIVKLSRNCGVLVAGAGPADLAAAITLAWYGIDVAPTGKRGTPSGMNTAIHDSFDLGWKPTRVLRGWASPGLPATCHRERRRWTGMDATAATGPHGSALPDLPGIEPTAAAEQPSPAPPRSGAWASLRCGKGVG
jgi:hypothetical protein